MNNQEALLSALDEVALVSITDAQGIIIFVNDKFVETSHFSRQELIGHNHRILKSGDQPDILFEDLWKTISGGRVWRGDIANRTKDGSLYWADTSVVPIQGPDGKPEQYVAVRFLITDKKESREQIGEQHREFERTKSALVNALENVEQEKERIRLQSIETKKFALAVEGASEHIVITDPNGIIIYANHAAELITGFSKDEIIGTKAGTLWGGLMGKEFYQRLWETIAVRKETFQGEIRNKRKSGAEYTVSTNISPVMDEKQHIMFFVVLERDITREKEVDKAKTEFVSLASHQLRTPLSAINWYAEMLLEGDAGTLTEQQKSYLQEIYHGNQRMVELVNALLDVSRIEMGTFSVRPELTDIVALAQSEIAELQPQIDAKKLTCVADFQQGLPQLNVDPELIRIIIENILTNAVKYTPNRGTITLALHLDDERRNLVLTVSDTGYGIPQDEQAKIFTKLFRANNVREMEPEGTGLGLYIVQSILDHTGGSIRFESEENKGTTFYITCPVSGMKEKDGTVKLGHVAH